MAKASSDKKEKGGETTVAKKKRKRQLFYKLALLMAVPLFIMGVVLVIVGNASVTEGMELEIRERLRATARESSDLYFAVYPGEIKVEDGNLVLGSEALAGNTLLADRIKENTGSDISVFLGDIRILTTIPAASGEGRITGSKVENPTIMEAIKAGNEYYSAHTVIEGQKYFTYYIPIKRGDEVVGFLEAAQPNNDVKSGASTISVKIGIVFAVAFLIILLLSSGYIKSLVDRLDLIKNYIGELAENRVNSTMPAKVMKTNDEISEMGDYAIEVGKKVRILIFYDPLTQIYNRRAGRMELSKYMELADLKQRANVTVALGDIDHFKRVNDTFGHDAGDAVLVECARLFREYTQNNAFCVRWGGEEFLLVFDDTLENTMVVLEALLDEIRENVIEHDGTTLNVTMTFGVVQYETGQTIDQLIKRADDLLYTGKENGRNQIVT